LTGSCDIHSDGNSATAITLNLQADLFGLGVVVAKVHGNVGPGLGQSHCYRPSHAPAGSGHKGDFSSQFLAHILPFYLFALH
jgi:hypothetical protein